MNATQIPSATSADEPCSFLSVTQLAKQMGVNHKSVRQWIWDGDLQAVNCGTKQKPLWRIAPAAVSAFLERRSTKLRPRACQPASETASETAGETVLISKYRNYAR